MYSEPSLTYSEGLGKDNILNAETRHVTALCQFSESSTLFSAEKLREPQFPRMPPEDPGNAAGLLNMKGRRAPLSSSFLMASSQ